MTFVPVRSEMSFSKMLSSPTKTDAEYEFPTSSGAFVELPIFSSKLSVNQWDFMNILLYSW
jgi:hypothetical protein